MRKIILCNKSATISILNFVAVFFQAYFINFSFNSWKKGRIFVQFKIEIHNTQRTGLKNRKKKLNLEAK